MKVNILKLLIKVYINIGVGKKTLLNCIKTRYQNNNLYTSFAFTKQTSFISEKEDDSIDCVRLFFLLNLVNKNKQLIICLRLYDSQLSKTFLITPQAIILLYDITSKESFDSVINYYNNIKDDKKYINIKCILVGNKIDLIDEEKEENEKNDESCEKNTNNEINKQKKEENELDEINEKQIEKEEKNKIEQNKINNINYYKNIVEKEKFDLLKVISGLNGFYLEDLLNEIALLLFKNVKEMENIPNYLYQLERDSIVIENKLDINDRQKSYHDIEYKKEVNKINKSNNKICCMMCNIF